MRSADRDWTQNVLALSISDSPDFAVLGLLPGEDKRMLTAVLTPLIYNGARIAYGGRINPASATNFTTEIGMQLAAAYRKSGGALGTRPYIHFLRDNDARREGPEALFTHALQLGGYSEVRLLRGSRTCASLLPAGDLIDVYMDDEPVGVSKSPDDLLSFDPIAECFHEPTGRDELAEMREAMATQTSVRIIMGGRTSGGSGGTSGVASEALTALRAGKPLLVLGGLGGASRDVAFMLGLIDEADRVDRKEDAYRDSEGEPSKDRYWSLMEEIGEFRDRYTEMLVMKDLVTAAKQLANSDTYAEVGMLLVRLIDTLLIDRDDDLVPA